MSISIVVPNWNRQDLTEECLTRILKTSPEELDYDIIAIDNGSTDGTAEKLAAFACAHQRVTVVLNKTNLRWAKASNQGLDISQKEYIVFSQNDVFFEGDALSAVIEGFRSTSHECIGPAGADIRLVGGRVRHRERANPGVVGYVGTMIALRRDYMIANALRWDEGYEFFYEDPDMAMQVRKAGGTCGIVSLPVRHLRKQTFVPLTGRPHAEKVRRESERRFIAKWGKSFDL
jgi:GT2 family glycosyltransferase